MPADVPVVAPAGRVRRAFPDAWLQAFWLWDAYFAVVLAAALVLLATTGDGSPGGRAVAAGLLLAGALAYAVVGRPAFLRETESGRGALYFGALLVLFVSAALLSSGALWALFAVIPQAFLALSLRSAIVVTVALNLLPVVRELAFEGFTSELAYVLVPMAVLLATLGIAIGRWIDRIVTQSQERAELIEQLQSSRDEVAALSEQTGAAAERERIARDIHDTLAQGFASIAALLHAATAELDDEPELARRHIELAGRAARENLDEARTLVTGLTPAPLESASLPEAIARHTERVGAESGIHADAHVAGTPRPLPANLAVVLLRAAQESLANVARHAGAGTVRVALSYCENCVALDVADDGCGFDATTVAGGFGLRGMAARLEQVGGRLDVRSTPGAGTTIRAEVPL